MSKILVFGKNGQVGTALEEIFGSKARIVSKDEANFAEPESLTNFLAGTSPSHIINAAAYTGVDLAETEIEKNHLINAVAPEIIAKFCKEKDIPLIHYSTDYVFPGTGDVPWKPNDPTKPINEYGKAKLAGEEAIRNIGGKYLIFRTSWVYDHLHKNFFTTMLKLGMEKDMLSIVDDQIGAPTYAPDIAAATIKALDNFQSGTYHLCNEGYVSWFDFASKIFTKSRYLDIHLRIEDIIPLDSDEYKTPAKRPLNSRLDCTDTSTMLGIKMPDWEDSLKKCLEKYVASNKN